MATLRKIAHQIADSINRPFDTMLYYRLRDYIIQESATLLQQTMDKDGVDKEYVATQIIPMMIVNASELRNEITSDKILRSVNKIHTPVRYKNYTPFVYVGTRDGGHAFSFINNYVNKYHHHLPYVGEQITYDFMNKHLYVYNNIRIEEVRTDGIYPFAIMDTFRHDVIEQQGECYIDDMEFPLPLDLINPLILKIKQLLLSPVDIQTPVLKTHVDNN